MTVSHYELLFYLKRSFGLLTGHLTRSLKQRLFSLILERMTVRAYIFFLYHNYDTVITQHCNANATFLCMS